MPSVHSKRSKKSYGGVMALFGIIGLLLIMPWPAGADAGQPLTEDDFVPAAPQGFGDRQNSWAWSMQWWKGALYVGTNRAYHCTEIAGIHAAFPWLVSYPPNDPDIECTPYPEDLPLQAEIWRWTPPTGSWELVYRSPNDVPIPGKPGKWIARDIGFRGMSVVTEPDGTEALYVSGVSAKYMGYLVPPPRILRSTDGVNFQPIPQNPGTPLGNFQGSSFRSQATLNGRFYVVGGSILGSGVVFESDNPAAGNDSFRVISPPDVNVMVIAAYNGSLYMGVRDALRGYSIIKTDAQGPLPYRYKTVVERGGYLNQWRNPEVLTMKVYDGRLYVGGNGIALGLLGLMAPAELIRINPDDSWDVIVGYPRRTPQGWKAPLSGLTAGFGNFLNNHMWQMEEFEGNLYVGTFDSSTTFKDNPDIAPILEPIMGFDLYSSPNGIDFSPVTITGFGDRFNFGVRTMAATLYGLFVGTANYYYGLQVWQAEREPHRLYLPLLATGSIPPSRLAEGAGQQKLIGPRRETESPPLASAPLGLMAEMAGQAALLSWEPQPGAAGYRVLRAESRRLKLPLREPIIVSVPTAFTAIGETEHLSYADTAIEPDQQYLYIIEAMDGAGRLLCRSNMVSIPSVAPLATFESVRQRVAEVKVGGALRENEETEVISALVAAQEQFRRGDVEGAARTIQALRWQMGQGQRLSARWVAQDLDYWLNRLARRIRLIELGFIAPTAMEP
jgi:hypothetical protein